MRWFLHLAYKGGGFSGWQAQPGGVRTVQGVLEDALGKLMRCPTPLTGAGRTDAGVNASMMVAHFDTATDIPDTQRFIASLNGMADPRAITVFGLTKVADDAHARFDATSRTYRYYFHLARTPFLEPLSWRAPATLDIDAMNEAGRLLLGVRDFTSFAKLHSDARTNICRLDCARIVPVESDESGSRYYLEIRADRFLRNMVRAVMGTLADVGRHKISPSGVIDIADRLDRCAAGTSMPPEPLFLHEITYPYWSPAVMCPVP
ncbi:MAG: tRNA pseudouridine(38-40) synthase TruA [Muribaculaceae bacterium]|nr:tRNA pseudouridine(38-40) synthase TruA [Muribaculaceae bacterium]